MNNEQTAERLRAALTTMAADRQGAAAEPLQPDPSKHEADGLADEFWSGMQRLAHVAHEFPDTGDDGGEYGDDVRRAALDLILHALACGAGFDFIRERWDIRPRSPSVCERLPVEELRRAYP